jgi:hypothetical protein
VTTEKKVFPVLSVKDSNKKSKEALLPIIKSLLGKGLGSHFLRIMFFHFLFHMYVHNVSDYDLYRKLKVKAKKLTMAILSTEKKKKCSISGYTICTYYYLKMKNS